MFCTRVLPVGSLCTNLWLNKSNKWIMIDSCFCESLFFTFASMQLANCRPLLFQSRRSLNGVLQKHLFKADSKLGAERSYSIFSVVFFTHTSDGMFTSCKMIFTGLWIHTDTQTSAMRLQGDATSPNSRISGFLPCKKTGRKKSNGKAKT